jgi:acyl-coenzyme A synthetase/AMP-(fatty) acid ligase
VEATLPSPRMIGLPVIWDRDEEGPDEPTSPRIRARAARLVRALTAMGVEAGQRVVVLCCSEHVEDRRVAVAAIKSIGAVAIVPEDWSRPSLTRLLGGMDPRTVHLACEEGVDGWRAARGSGVMIGDGLGVLWWKALECRYAVADLAG